MRSGFGNTFGPIFTVYLGRTPIIFVTSASLTHASLVEESRLFADRPLFPSRKLFTSNFRNINSSPYGPFWRLIRRNLVENVFAVPNILAFRPARLHAIARIISNIRTVAKQNQGAVSVYPTIRLGVFEILLFMCFGYRMQEEEILEMSELLLSVGKLAEEQILDIVPLLKIFRPGKDKADGTLRARQVQVFTSRFQKYKELRELGQVTRGSYLESLQRMDLTTSEIVTLCSEFMLAGTDTTVTTLEWAMAHLVRNPSIQSKLYRHIRDVVGDRPVEEADLQHLPYLRAIIQETLRLNPPGHTLLPHAVSEPAKLGGYDIPCNAIVMFDILTMSRDPAIWKEPLMFNPERFMQLEVDMTGSKGVTMIPFGAGRRICPGLELATMHMEMLIAHLVQTFEWSNWPAGKEVNLAVKQHFTVRMKYNLKASVKERAG
ncbi:hypothetical protein KP509_10G029300 [Ceratopteris richardii]|nr:hypothetical protein KP509_10G029300 [Ceratopteris richardii]